MTTATRDLIYISYHHRDRDWLERLETHLQPLVRKRSITVWSDTRVRAGAVWRDEIEAALARARVAVVLVSADYLGSETLGGDELPRLVAAAERREMRLLWLLVGPCLHEETGLERLQPLGDPGKPLAVLAPGDAEAELAQASRRIAEAGAVTPDAPGAAPVRGADTAVPASLGAPASSFVERANAGDWAGVRALVVDVGYLEERCREADVAELEEELRAALATAGAEGEMRALLELLERTVRQESHRLRAEPEALRGLLYYRLRSLGWDEGRIRATWRFPDGFSPLRLRHPVRLDWGEERTLAGHAGRVMACAVTADGTRVVSGGADGTVKVWELSTGRLLQTLQCHGGPVWACAVTPGGTRVVSGGRTERSRSGRWPRASSSRHTKAMREGFGRARSRPMVGAWSRAEMTKRFGCGSSRRACAFISCTASPPSPRSLRHKTSSWPAMC